ncbi:hypothetical protein LJR143_003946 [Pseudoxanthomonas sp. LjRoot143]|uniref:hypothetical protein n=1 Tax=Pseudoxanthomonas sp. LjRoot143 TaxID=3342266 RepID=UPI003ECF2088
MLLVACGCGDNEKAVASARALTQARLTKLHADLARLETPADLPPGQWHAVKDIPVEFSDLHPRELLVDGRSARIYLSGCVDDKIMLVATGMDGSESRRIRLLPREDAGAAIVLWTDPRGTE